MDKWTGVVRLSTDGRKNRVEGEKDGPGVLTKQVITSQKDCSVLFIENNVRDADTARRLLGKSQISNLKLHDTGRLVRQPSPRTCRAIYEDLADAPCTLRSKRDLSGAPNSTARNQHRQRTQKSQKSHYSISIFS